MVLRIKDWDEHFENNRTRELKQMRWVPFKNSFDSDGYIELIEDHENGMAHFGAWVLIVEVASTCEERGVLLRSSGQPHTGKTLSRKVRGNHAIFEEAIPRLIEIGWLEEISQDGAVLSQASAYGMEGRKEGKEDVATAPRKRVASAPKIISLEEYQKIIDLWAEGTNLLPFKEAYPAINPKQELNKAVLWLKNNPTKRKKNLGRFFNSWCNSAQERGGYSRGNSGATAPSLKEFK